MGDRYPILIDGGPKGDDALRVGCNGCARQWQAEGVDDSITWVECRPCPHCGSSAIYYVYESGSACPGCGVLAYSHPAIHAWCCSRVCELQAAWSAYLRLRDLAAGYATRDIAAADYARALAIPDLVDWVKVNGGLVDRWSQSGLKYVKRKAWERWERWQRGDVGGLYTP